MAKSEAYTFKGTCKWARVFLDDRDTTAFNEETGEYDLPHPAGGRYSINLKMDDKDYRILKGTGSIAAKNSKLDMEDGADVVKLGRDHEKKDFNGNLMDWVSGPPIVVKADGSPWVFENDGHIWNGSEVEVTLDLYKTKFAPRTTLMKVKVLNLADEPVMDSGPKESDDIPF